MGIKAIAPDGKQVELVTKDELGSEGPTTPARIELILTEKVQGSPLIVEIPNCNVGDVIYAICLTHENADTPATLDGSKKITLRSVPDGRNVWLILANGVLKYVLCATPGSSGGGI